MNILNLIKTTDQRHTLARFAALAAPYVHTWTASLAHPDGTLRAVCTGEDWIWELTISPDGSYCAREAGISEWRDGIEGVQS